MRGEESSRTKGQFKTHPPCRILVVDDDVGLRELSAFVLTRSGYQADTAEDGVAGWEALQACSYDLLITDHNMPRVCGLELVKQLRSAGMSLPVVLASGDPPPEAINGNSSLQLAATLFKPFSTGDLLSTVKKILGEPNPAWMETRPMALSQGEPSACAPWLNQGGTTCPGAGYSGPRSGAGHGSPSRAPA